MHVTPQPSACQSPDASEQEAHAEHLPGLLPHHLADLRRSGLSDETIRRAGIYSETDRRKLAALLNRKSWPRAFGAGLVFPFHDDGGNVVLHRVKPDNPPMRAGKPAGKYLSPSGSTVRVYLPPGVDGELGDATRPIMLVEGEKKALCLVQLGLAAVGLTGVDCWHARQSSGLIPDLARIEWHGRRVFIGFDSDAADNANVRANERLLAAALRNHGAVVRIVRIPPGPNGEKMGADDFIVGHGQAAFWRLIETAEEPEPVEAGELKQPVSELLPEDEAGRFLESNRQDGFPLVRYWRDAWWVWQHGCYRESAPSEVAAAVTTTLNRSFFKVGRQAVGNVVAQLQAQAILPGRLEPPTWLGKAKGSDWNPADLLVCRNGIVHLPSLFDGVESFIPATPALFATAALEFDFVPADRSPRPERWLRFLDELWHGDPEAIEALRLWCGYLLTPDTRQQKLLALFGPKRAGKGVLCRVLVGLVGRRNVAAPTLASLASGFGLWPLIGKPLAIIGDARLSGKVDDRAIVERLLAITGEDELTIDRKFQEPVTCRLPTRIMLVSNELPRLADASGALASRMICLRLTESWLGREDHGLTDALLAELPGILWWAIGGWWKLRQQGRLLQPQSGAEMLAELEDLGSPVGRFLRERCLVGPEHSVPRRELYEAYANWARAQGRDHVEDEGGFGRNLRAVLPRLRDGQPRIDGVPVRHYIGLTLRATGATPFP